MGSKGSIASTVLGVLLMGALNSGMNMLNVSIEVQLRPGRNRALALALAQFVNEAVMVVKRRSDGPHTPVFQFGTSRFLQAHAALFVHEALQRYEGAGPITVVAISGSASGRARLKALADTAGYPVVVRGLEDSRASEREICVRSIRRALDAETDWRQLAELFAEEAEFVVSNSTEAGFAVPPNLTLDLARRPTSAPPGYPAKLLALLAHRFSVSPRPVVVLPTELIQRNGDVLRTTVVELAQRSGASAALLGFLTIQCVFANSLVDRIVSSPLEPAGAVAEPYALWAVERQTGLTLPCRHPAIKLVADLEPFERLKLHILNLGHSVLAHHWIARRLSPELTVREMLGIREFRNILVDIYRTEVLPGFASRGMLQEAEGYATTTLERFDNPFLDHRLSDIATGHPYKVHRRIGGFLEWVQAKDGGVYRSLAEVLRSTG